MLGCINTVLLYSLSLYPLYLLRYNAVACCELIVIVLTCSQQVQRNEKIQTRKNDEF